MSADDSVSSSSSKGVEEAINPFSSQNDSVNECMNAIASWEAMTVPIANKVEALLGSQPPATILDLACGRGDVAIALAQRGYEVTALDYNPAMLSVAMELSRLKPNHLNWICADMRTIAYKAEMNYVLLRDVIFSIFDSRADDKELLCRIADSLKPGGRCLLEVYNKEFAQSHSIENRLVYDKKRDLFVDNGKSSIVQSARLYTLNEWHEMLNDQGLTIVAQDGWRWKNDPAPLPWRADFIVAEKSIHNA